MKKSSKFIAGVGMTTALLCSSVGAGVADAQPVLPEPRQLLVGDYVKTDVVRYDVPREVLVPFDPFVLKVDNRICTPRMAILSLC